MELLLILFVAGLLIWAFQAPRGGNRSGDASHGPDGDSGDSGDGGGGGD